VDIGLSPANDGMAMEGDIKFGRRGKARHAAWRGQMLHCVALLGFGELL
jgi:hypothetical protein